ncbi:MAG: type II toxin-antitoxin system RelE/ParE family toxin [Nanoarchaeota archaeon]
MYTIEWKETVLKSLERLDKSITIRIIKRVNQLKESPFKGDIRKLKGAEHEYRLRVGDYRVIFEVVGENINILKVGHRQNIYDYSIS